MNSEEEKRIIITQHARERMRGRGATMEEIIRTINEGAREPAKRKKWHSILQFEFDSESPISGLHYTHKTVDVVFAEEPERIVVLTIKVYYHND